MCASVAVPLVSWRSHQKPPVIRTSSRPNGRNAPRVGMTGVTAEWVVVVMVIP